tara:strand:+ start:1055 stop:1399 length:345 start_codon:yes stop_codon:yes gene_type:complete
MATLTSQRISEAGLVPTLTTLDSSNKFTNTGREFILYTNATAASKTLTVTAQVTSIDSPIYGDITKADSVKVVTAGQTVLIGPFPPDAYSDTNGEVTFAITTFVEGEQAAILYL